MLHQDPLAAGGISAVHHMAAAVAQQIPGHDGILVGAADGGGHADIYGLVAAFVGFLKQIHQDLGRGLSGFGRMAGGKKQIIELVLGKIDVFLIFGITEHDGDGNAMDIQLLDFRRGKVSGGIGDDSDHKGTSLRNCDRYTNTILLILCSLNMNKI